MLKFKRVFWVFKGSLKFKSNDDKDAGNRQKILTIITNQQLQLPTLLNKIKMYFLLTTNLQSFHRRI